MKRLLLPFVIGFTCLSSLSFAEKEKILYCMPEMPPYWFKNKEGKVVGAIANYVEALHEDQNEYEASLQLYPQKRCDDMLKTGEAQVLPMYRATPERLEFSTPSMTVYYDAVYYWFNKNHNSEESMNFKNLAEMKAKGKICGRQGFIYSETSLTPADMDTGTPTVDQLAKKLEVGNCNMIVERYWVLKGIELASQGKIKISMDPNVIGKSVPESQKTQLHILISKKYKNAEKLANWANKQIAHVWASGKFTTVYSKWVSEGVAKDYAAKFGEFHNADAKALENSTKK